MIDLSTALINTTGIHPDVLAIDASGAGATNGTEFIADGFINNGIFGFIQGIMDYADGKPNLPAGTPGSPNGVTEAAGLSQLVQAIGIGFSVGPGIFVGSFINDLPIITKHRIILLQGQGVSIITYESLDGATWVTDIGPGFPVSGYNAAVHAGGGKFYRSSDSAGTTPDITGPYLQLPEMRGYVPRGLDLAASVDPEGAGRFLGDNQVDAFQGHRHTLVQGSSSTSSNTSNAPNSFSSRDQDGRDLLHTNAPVVNLTMIASPIELGVFGVPRLDSESRMTNTSIHWGITY